MKLVYTKQINDLNFLKRKTFFSIESYAIVKFLYVLVSPILCTSTACYVRGKGFFVLFKMKRVSIVNHITLNLHSNKFSFITLTIDSVFDIFKKYVCVTAGKRREKINTI